MKVNFPPLRKWIRYSRNLETVCRLHFKTKDGIEYSMKRDNWWEYGSYTKMFPELYSKCLIDGKWKFQNSLICRGIGINGGWGTFNKRRRNCCYTQSKGGESFWKLWMKYPTNSQLKYSVNLTKQHIFNHIKPCQSRFTFI